jgi:RimJ/RimL family protein N-acetyltransferase
MTSHSIILRQWEDGDLEQFAAMNSDPEVMQFMLKSLTRDESIALLARFRTAIDQKGWGLWAVEVEGAFAGFTGLSEPTFSAHFTPCVEIGWRLRREFWGLGVAYAAALQAESFAFRSLKIPELVSFTTAGNTKSRNLMQRLGFSRNTDDDFLHPGVPADHPLRPHVLYRKKETTYSRQPSHHFPVNGVTP